MKLTKTSKKKITNNLQILPGTGYKKKIMGRHTRERGSISTREPPLHRTKKSVHTFLCEHY